MAWSTMATWMTDWGWLPAALLPFVASVSGAGSGGSGPMGRNGPIDDSDHELVRLVLDGDGTAYRGLVERYQGRIYNVCYGMVRNPEDAKDLAQDAFVKAFKNLHRFRLESSFYTWLCRIAMNVSIDWLRRQKVRKAEAFDEGIASRDSSGVISLAHHRNDPGKDLERKRIYAAILDALDELPEDQRHVVVLLEIEGMAYKEIASVLDIPEGTVMSRLYYARKKLQSSLEGVRG